MAVIKNDMELQGTLFQYGNDGMVAFESPQESDVHYGYIVFVGGLDDGFMSCQFITDLVESVSVKGYSVVQMLLRSSYAMYGTKSIADDVDDIDGLVATLIERYKDENNDLMPHLVLIGHSTGCQDVITYLRDGKAAECITGAVLLSAVSDREYIQTLPQSTQHLAKARQMIDEGKGDALLDRAVWSVPITAQRYASLAGRLTQDDLFSSDLTDEELESLYAHVRVPSLWIWGSADEFMPAHIDKERLGERVEWAIKCDTCLVFVKGANHKLENHADQVVNEISQFVTNRAKVFGELIREASRGPSPLPEALAKEKGEETPNETGDQESTNEKEAKVAANEKREKETEASQSEAVAARKRQCTE